MQQRSVTFVSTLPFVLFLKKKKEWPLWECCDEPVEEFITKQPVSHRSSCTQAVAPYEKILENDAVRVYHDLVWRRRNPIKMMKKPHLGTSQGPRPLECSAAGGAEVRGVAGGRWEGREVITVVRLTGNVASP